MSPLDLDPRKNAQVVEDLAVADAEARPVVARANVGVPTPMILAGFGLLGLCLFFWMSAQRTGATAAPRATSASTPAVSTVASPVSGPMYAVPAPQFTEDNSSPVPQMVGAEQAPATPGATVVDLAQRRRAPALVVDFGSDRPAMLAKTGGDAAPMATKAGPGDGTLSADERFADRVAMAEAEPARAVAMRDLDATIPQGAVIPAVMETAINSDLPGLARAMVVRDVKSFDGSAVLIPRGSRVIGQYKSGVALGASRVFVIWTRVIRPDGVSIQIASPAADPLGRGGLAGKVDRHFFNRFGGSILMSVLNAGVAAVGNARSTSQIYIGSAAQAANLAGSVVKTDQGVAPTVQTRQGAPVTIFVARDLDFSGVRSDRS